MQKKKVYSNMTIEESNSLTLIKNTEISFIFKELNMSFSNTGIQMIFCINESSKWDLNELDIIDYGIVRLANPDYTFPSYEEINDYFDFYKKLTNKDFKACLEQTIDDLLKPYVSSCLNYFNKIKLK